MPKKANTFGGQSLATIAACCVFALAGCAKNDERKCAICTTTQETWFQAVKQDSEVESVRTYCNGEADTVKQGTVQTKFYSNGAAEKWVVECTYQ